MALTYSEHIAKPASEKIVLAHMEPAQRLIKWSVFTTDVFIRDVSFYVIDLEQDGVSLTEVNSSGAIVEGSWFFDSENKKLYVHTTGSVDPEVPFVVATYRLFFSNAPINLPYNLTDSGDIVEYDPRISSTSKFGSVLESDAQIGIALEGNGQVSFSANDGFFDDLYDKLFWENKSATIYSVGRNVPVADKQILYEGIIEEKSFSPTTVSFKLRDFVTQLRNTLPLPVFSDVDGDFPSDLIGLPKRRIYGRRDGHLLQSLEMVLDGFEIDGTYSGTADSLIVTASGGPDLFDILTPEDELFFTTDFGDDIRMTVDVVSGSSFTVASEPSEAFTGQALRSRPKRPWRKKNRAYIIAGHKVGERETTVTDPLQLNRIVVADVTDFSEGDFLTFTVGASDVVRQTRRISANEIILFQNLPGLPALGSTVKKSGVQDVFYSKIQFNRQRDFTVDQSGTDAKLVLDDLAEFNVAPVVKVTGLIDFTNGSRDLLGVGTLFRSEFEPRDWIKASERAESYEILEVIDDLNMKIRTVFSTATLPGVEATRRNPLLIDDDTKVTCSAFGKTIDSTSTGTLLSTASDVVKDLLTETGLGAKLNATSFSNARVDAPYLMSLGLPLEHGKEAPIVRDIISTINRSIFGSLRKDTDFNINFDVLKAAKPANIIKELKDDDIIDWRVSSNSQNIVKNTVVNHRHEDAGRFTDERNATTINVSSDISTYLVKTDKEIVREVYVYNASDADLLMRRWAFFSEISDSIVTIKGKLNLADVAINDIVLMQLDRLYHRFGSRFDRIKMGAVSATTNNGVDVTLEVDDLSGWYFLVGNITENTALDFASADQRARALNGYITDLNGLIDDEEFSNRINLIQ